MAGQTITPLDVNGLTDTKQANKIAVWGHKKKCIGCPRYYRTGHGKYHSEACQVKNERKGE